MATAAPLRVCIVGTGARGNAHAKGWLATSEATITAVVDVDEARARELAQTFGASHVFTDYRQALQRDDIDVASICTPAYYHEEIAIFAAQHGKHMLCEKPLALRLDQADRMIAALDAAQVVFVVNFQSRFGDPPAVVRQLYRDGALGHPVLFRLHTGAPIRPKLAMHDMDRGNGGPLNDFTCHFFDYWRWLTGTDPMRVTAQGFTFARGRPEVAHFTHLAPDTAAVTVAYGSGDLGAITITWGLPPGVQPPQQVNDILGPQGVLAPGRPTGTFTLFQEGGKKQEFGPFTTDSQLELTRHVIRAIRDGESVQASARDARVALAVTWAVYASLEQEGTPVAVSPTP